MVIHAVECLNIFEIYPHWDHGPKCLKLPAIEDGNRNILAKVDHINPDSWKGDVRLASVLPVTSRNSGHKMVEFEHVITGIHAKLEELEKNGLDMTFPFGMEDIEDDKSEDSDDDTADEEDDEETAQVNLSESEVLAVLEVPVFRVGEGPILDLEDHIAIKSN